MSDINAHILIVEDEPIVRTNLVVQFEEEGYKVTAVDNGNDVLDLVEQHQPDLVLLDINLPGKDGLTLTRELRSRSQDVGIILVTAKQDEVDRIVGLEIGADDYVTKPFNARELLTRSKNLLRRVQTQHGSKSTQLIRRFAGWQLDQNRRLLTAPGGEPIRLPKGEFQLLNALLDNAGQILSRDQLMYSVRNRDWSPNDRYIDVLIGQVRRRLSDAGAEQEFISTVHGSGYLFTAELE